jgi:hypothetical protein
MTTNTNPQATETRVTAHENPQGYSDGTWEYRITEPDGGMRFDGGYQTRALALSAGLAKLAKLRREGVISD